MTDPSIALSFRKELRECVRCDLRGGCTTPVAWGGGLGAEVAVIGEAPGEQEDKAGEPFIGTAGQKLRTLLPRAGVDPSKVAYVNSCQCWPRRGLDANQDRQYIDTCRVWMRGQIAMIQPQYVITVGVVAFYSVFNRAWPKLSQLHGKPLFWDNPPLPAKPRAIWSTYHPSAALRSGKYHRIIEEDFTAFKEWRENGEPWLECCSICGEELERYDGYGVGYCARHGMRQSGLFAEEITV